MRKVLIPRWLYMGIGSKRVLAFKERSGEQVNLVPWFEKVERQKECYRLNHKFCHIGAGEHWGLMVKEAT